MNLRINVFTLATLAVVFSLASQTLADDFDPPPWRSQPRTTFAQWEFDTPDPLPVPDLGYNPYSPPFIQVTPGLNQGWLSDYNDRSGVWELSGEILVEIENYPVPLRRKELWIQLTWTPQSIGQMPGIDIVSEPVGELVDVGSTTMELPSGWNHTTFHYEILPNPDREQIRIFGDINVDELIIDTRCLPEPASISLLVLGTVVLIRRP